KFFRGPSRAPPSAAARSIPDCRPAKFRHPCKLGSRSTSPHSSRYLTPGTTVSVLGTDAVGDIPTAVNKLRRRYPCCLLFMIGLDFEEVEGLLLAESISRVVGAGPIGNNQCCGHALGAKNFPMIGDPNWNLRLRVRGIHFGKRFLWSHFDAFEGDRTDEPHGLLHFPGFCIHQILVIAREHFHRIQPSRLKVLNRLGKDVWPLLTPFHPEKSVADMFRIGRPTQSHVAPLNSSVSGKTSGGNAPFFRRMQRPALGPFLKIRILNVGKEKWVAGQKVGVALDGVMTIELADKAHGFLVRQK